jgi:hypothetical protein
MEVLYKPTPLPHRSNDSRQIQPLAIVIRHYWPGTTVDIFPIIMSRISTPHTSTMAASPPSSPTPQQTCLENTARHHTHPNTTPLAKCPMVAPSPYHLSHQIPHDYTQHLHLPHPHTTLPTASTLTHDTLPGGRGGENPNHPLDMLDLGGCTLACQVWHGYNVSTAHHEVGVSADGPTSALPSGTAAGGRLVARILVVVCLDT